LYKLHKHNITVAVYQTRKPSLEVAQTTAVITGHMIFLHSNKSIKALV